MDNQNNWYDNSTQNTQMSQGYQRNYQSSQNYVQEESSTKESKSKSSLAIILILLILLIAAVAYIFLGNKKQYAVVFVNGENIEAVIVKEGSKVEEQKVEDESFSGWYYGSTKYNFENAVTDNIVLKAVYNGKKYTVNFDTIGGSTISSVSVKENELVIKPTNPTKEGYTFKEWQLNEIKYDFNTPVTSNITLTALWEALDPSQITYVVTFDTDGGNTIRSINLKGNEKVTKPSNPTKEGYAFKEWQLNGEKYDFNTPITSNITLKAIYDAKERITITFDTDGGSKVDNMEIYAGDTATLPTPTKANYKFGGWYSGTTKYTNDTVIKKSVTLKAKWLTEDEEKLETALAAIKSSYDITKGGQVINVTSTGCTIENTNGSDFSKIIRKSTDDSSKTLKFKVTCGTATAEKTAKAVIKKSTYTYTATPNSNMQNYDVKINGLSGNGTLYSTGGSFLSDISSGNAVVNNEDISGYPKFLIKLSNDKNTTYEVTNK